MSNKEKADLRRIFREAAGLIATKKSHFCCDAIRGAVGEGPYGDFQWAKGIFEEIFRPPHHKMPVDSYGWWWSCCDEPRCRYNPREARIVALLLAAELV